MKKSESTLKTRPILFIAPMVRAILDGSKTMTRRVCNLIPPSATCPACPYGQPGDRLWVRETWQICDTCGVINYAADQQKHCTGCDALLGKWKPSIHIPCLYSRITLEIVSVRVERVQDISEEDAKAEGMHTPEIAGVTHKDLFHVLWDSINAKRGYGWSQNPWVWQIGFKRVS